MGGNYAAPPRNAALSRIPRGISGPFKKGNAVLRSHPRVGVSIYTRHREIKRRSHPQSEHIPGNQPRGWSGGGSSLCFILTPGFRFVMHSNERSSLRIRENLGRERWRREGGGGFGRSANQTAIAIFISAWYLRAHGAVILIRADLFSPPVECRGKWIEWMNDCHDYSRHRFSDSRGKEIRFAMCGWRCGFGEEERKVNDRVIIKWWRIAIK